MDQQESQNETKSIELVITRFKEAWNQHDAKEFAALFVQDGEWIDIMGQVMQGRGGIEQGHHYPFSTVQSKATLSIQDQRIKWIRPDVAAVTFSWEVTGSQTPDGKPVPTRNGLINLVLSKEGEEGWRIVMGNNVDYTAVYKRSDFVKE